EHVSPRRSFHIGATGSMYSSVRGSNKRRSTSEETDMDLGLKDRVALVAAASRGIGYAAARELAREGARVFLCSRDERRASEAAENIHNETGADVAGVAADVTN